MRQWMTDVVCPDCGREHVLIVNECDLLLVGVEYEKSGCELLYSELCPECGENMFYICRQPEYTVLILYDLEDIEEES